MALSTQTFGGVGDSERAISSLIQWKERQQQCAEQVDLRALLTIIRTALRAQGLIVWVNMSLALEKAQSESGGLTNGTLKRLLNDCRVPVSDVDARALVQGLEQNAKENGRVTADAIKNLIFGSLSGRKLEFVQSSFDALDRKGVGYLPLQDILAAHDAARHPAVMFGEQTSEQVSREFLTAFMTAARRTGTAFVSWAQWLTYFQCVAAQAPSDEYFELLMKRVWHADVRCSLQEAAGAADFNSRMNSMSLPTPAPVAPMSSLQHNQGTSNKVVLSISTTMPSKDQHFANSSSLSPMNLNTSPRATAASSTHEFLKGSQFAACLTEVASPTSPVSNTRSRKAQYAASLDPGAASVLRKLQSSLRARGLHALVQLGRCLRLADADDDSSLTLSEFLRALQNSYEATSVATSTALNDADLRGLFRHLDYDGAERVSVEAALDLVRGIMSTRRLRLVQGAYQTLAQATGSALLDACDAVQRYDASRHPDVIAQGKSEEQCFREFVENFDMSESSDTKISLQQWEAYYHNVSFLVPDDDLFELIVRNTWQLPPTRSLAQAASKGRVPPPILTETSQGSGFAASSMRHFTSGSGEILWRGKRSSGTGMASQQTFAILQPDLVDHGSSLLSPSSAISLAKSCSPGAASVHSKELRRTIHSLRCGLKERGLGGFIALQQQLLRAARRSDDGCVDELNDANVDFHEFVRALKTSGVHVTGRDAQSLFDYFDSNHDGILSINEFLTGVREPMNARRQLIVRMAFDTLDRSGSGELDAKAIAAAFSARRLPEVITGRKSECEAHAEFLDTFGLVTEDQRRRRVNFDVWERYYANVSAAVDEDELFDQMLRSAWHLGSTSGIRAATSSNMSVEGQRQECRRSSVCEIMDHSAQYLSSPTSSSPASSPSITLRRARNNMSPSIAACLGQSPSMQQYEAATSMSTGSSFSSRQELRLHPAGVQAIVSKLKQVLQAQGMLCFCTFNRRLRATRSKAMNLQDLRSAAVDCELTLPGGLTDADLRLLFQYLDSDADGRIAPDEVVSIVRPPLSGRRLECVREAFAKVAKAKNVREFDKTLLEPSDIVEEFDAAAHPDVQAGRRKADDVCREFLETFDIDGGAQDGKVSWEQWRSNYHNVSAGIVSDKAFEEMMSSVWHLDGGTSKLTNKSKDFDPIRLQQRQDNQQSLSNGTTSASINTEAQTPLIRERKMLSLKEVASGIAMTDADCPRLDTEPRYTGDMILHAIRYRIRQSHSLADVVQLRARLNQAADPRTGMITSLCCCDALNAALSLSLIESHGRVLFEYLSRSSQANGDASDRANGRFSHEHYRVNECNNKSGSCLPLRLVLGSLLERLSPACLDSATRIFAVLQSRGKGRVFPTTLASSFQAARHPDVVLGRATAARVFQDFALHFEVAGGSGDVAVAFHHFEAYCVNLRATLGSDELLQFVLRDCFSNSS